MASENLIQQMTYSEDITSSPLHSHNNYQLIYVKKGIINLTVSYKKYTVSDHSLIFISNLEMHDITIESSYYKRYYVNISHKAADEMIKNQKLLSVFNNRPDGFKHALDVGDIKHHVERLFEQLFIEKTNEYPFKDDMSALLFKELLIILYRQYPNAYPVYNDTIINTIWEIKQYIEQNCQQNLSLNSISKKYHLSIYYLAHKFKMVTGYSVKQYLQFCRLSLAREMLCYTDKLIIEIAIESGFSDVSNFGRFFRREVGCTPTEYRKKYSSGSVQG